MKWLISTSQCPPGEFSYVQTEGIGRRFDRTPLIGELAATVADFRKGNKLPRAGKAEALEDIIRYTCDRLNNDPAFVFDTEHTVGELLPAASGAGCNGCGAEL